MRKARDFGVFVLLGVLIAVGVFACLRLHQLGRDEAALVAEAHQSAAAERSDLHAVSQQLVTTVQSLDAPIRNASALLRQSRTTLGKVDFALHEVNRGCDEARTAKPCGTLADFAKMLKTFRGAAGQVEIAAAHESKNLGTLDSQEAQLFADTHGDLEQLAATLKDADAVIADPATKQTQQNLAAISDNVAGIAHDGKVLADRFAGPQPWWKKILGIGGQAIKIAMCAAGKVTCTL